MASSVLNHSTSTLVVVFMLAEHSSFVILTVSELLFSLSWTYFHSINRQHFLSKSVRPFLYPSPYLSFPFFDPRDARIMIWVLRDGERMHGVQDMTRIQCDTQLTTCIWDIWVDAIYTRSRSNDDHVRDTCATWYPFLYTPSEDKAAMRLHCCWLDFLFSSTTDEHRCN